MAYSEHHFSAAASLPLRAVKHGKVRNSYCGPSAASIITGWETGKAAKIMRD